MLYRFIKPNAKHLAEIPWCIGEKNCEIRFAILFFVGCCSVFFFFRYVRIQIWNVAKAISFILCGIKYVTHMLQKLFFVCVCLLRFFLFSSAILFHAIWSTLRFPHLIYSYHQPMYSMPCAQQNTYSHVLYSHRLHEYESPTERIILWIHMKRISATIHAYHPSPNTNQQQNVCGNLCNAKEVVFSRIVICS